jgi:hypothetical protein
MDDDLGSFYEDENSEYHYFKLREKKGADVLFVSREVKFNNSITGQVTSKRYIRKVVDKEEVGQIVKVKGELVLQCTPGKREQVKAIVFDNDSGKMHFVLQKFRGDTGNPYKGTDWYFNQREFHELTEFLTLVRFIDLTDVKNFQVRASELQSKVLVDRNEHELLQAFKDIHGDERVRLLEMIKNENLTKDDIDVLSGRKEGLETFRRKLFIEKDWKEKEWQAFFEKNTWIFGYGLDYRFLSILQREASISEVDLDGKNESVVDFLLGSTEFTVLVELKRPDTPLFDLEQNRSRSWKLSKDLFYAVSQILSQKASWQLKSTSSNYDSTGDFIKQKTFDPKCILLVGSRDQYSDTDRDSHIKKQTFELFRRDSRNIEMLTYDELYDRAYFLVNQTLPNEKRRVQPQFPPASGE